MITAIILLSMISGALLAIGAFWNWIGKDAVKRDPHAAAAISVTSKVVFVMGAAFLAVVIYLATLT